MAKLNNNAKLNNKKKLLFDKNFVLLSMMC